MVASNEEVAGFDPVRHIMQIGTGKNAKDYLPVQWRLVWFRKDFPNGEIKTEMIHLDTETEHTEMISKWNKNRNCMEEVPNTAKGFAIFRATVSNGEGGVGTGTKSEKAASFSDFIEKAETGAIGRALASLGYGTQFTGDEFDEGHRIVDSPVDNGKQEPPKHREPQRPTPVPNNSPATDQQKVGINRLCGLMEKQSTLADDATFDQAAMMLKALSEEYKVYRSKAS